MRFDAGHTDVPNNGTRVLLSADAGINADPDNSNDACVGIVDVSATHGFVLEASDSVGLVLDPGKYGGTIKAGVIYFDVTTNGDDISWAILFE